MDISIEFENAHGVFVPGYEVSGFALFTVADKPLKARAVIISVEGSAKTSWTVSERHARGQTQATHRTVTYSGTVPYASGDVTVWAPKGGESAGHIPVGTHKFPFRFSLPSTCAPSFEGTSGYIRYFCKAKIDRPWKFDYTTRKVFTVVPTFDLNAIPSAANPVETQDSRDLGVLFFKHGRVHVTGRLMKGGFVPGESIVLHTDIQNDSSKTINKIALKLVESSRYVAYRNGYKSSSSKSTEERVFKRTVAQYEEKVEIGKGGTQQYSRMVPIPPVVPSFNTCPIISVEYYLKVKISANGMMKNSLTLHLPVLIGTVPIRHMVNQMATLPSSRPSTGRGSLVPPPSYEECVFGKGTVKDEEDNKDFAPRYVYYPNITPSAPPEGK